MTPDQFETLYGFLWGAYIIHAFGMGVLISNMGMLFVIISCAYMIKGAIEKHGCR